MGSEGGGFGASVPPGWYDDGTGTVRWWDGCQFLDRAAAGTGEPPARSDSSELLGMWLAFLLPPLGFWVGLALIARGSDRAVRVIVWSIVMTLAWALVPALIFRAIFSSGTT